MNATSPATVISVNPVKIPLGLLKPKSALRLKGQRIVAAESAIVAKRASTLQKRLNLFFGVDGKMSAMRSAQLLTIRLLFGLLLFVLPYLMENSIISTVAVQSMSMNVWMVIGIMLLTGSLERMLMIASAGWFAYILATGLIANGIIDSFSAVCVILSLALAMWGSGRFSVDTLIRHWLLWMMRRRRNRKAERRLSYKAYSINANIE
ncbi:MAG: hypothetical protein NC097_04150 [Clostridium sp.]|nr:hypothetical protein [Prevotella sp.]MCM1428969.1 hypothetical protein [Clostridium sp.]MCM1476003.1 hypothetical protein [Muribaculaceae bacterium]